MNQCQLAQTGGALVACLIFVNFFFALHLFVGKVPHQLWRNKNNSPLQFWPSAEASLHTQSPQPGAGRGLLGGFPRHNYKLNAKWIC